MKYRLVTPGPAMVPPETLLELAKPVIHHRTPENRAMIGETLGALKKVFCTENDVVILAGSGTAAMEASVANVAKPGQKVIATVCGKWGERWAEICKTFGVHLIPLEEPYGRAVSPDRIEKALRENPETVAVLTTLSETSTGVGMDIPAMGEIVAKTPALFVVDGISGVGAVECRTDDWKIDLLAVGSQKALMMPPGLAYLAVSDKAKKVIAEVDSPPAYYLNLKKALKSIADCDTPYTPAHTLIAAQLKSLQMLLADGMENVWKTTNAMSKATYAAAEVLGLQPFAERPVAALTVLKVPEGIESSKWEKLLEKKYSLKVAGGQGSMKGKIIRIGHMGYLDAFDTIGIVAALEWSLAELGHPVESGKAVAAATRVFAELYAAGK